MAGNVASPNGEMRYTHDVLIVNHRASFISAKLRYRESALVLIGFLLFILLMIANAGCSTQAVIEDLSINPAIIDITQHESTEISFSLVKPAYIKLYLRGMSTFPFYEAESSYLYPAGLHRIQFHGLVKGFLTDGEDYPFTVVQRAAPPGDYTVDVVASHANEVITLSHSLYISNTLIFTPPIDDLRVDPLVITPNNDGIDDAAMVYLTLSQDVDRLTVYALTDDGGAFPVPELAGASHPNALGRHIYHFEASPIMGEVLTDGTILIVVEVFDAYGQHIRWQQALQIKDTGEIQGYIWHGKVDYSSTTLSVGDELCFDLTVVNDGETYMRTIGPWSGTSYRDDANFVTLSFPEDKGVYRIGLDFESADGQYPFRWALGDPTANLVSRDGAWYLPPRHSSQVTGCVLITRLPEINPQYVWVGLLNEQTEQALVNHRVAPELIFVNSPTE